jgi:AAHS family 4-hydroxybenzoate transporter-like MFS transporter
MEKLRILQIADIIDDRRVSWFQYQTFFLCSLVALMDGFDTQAIGYVAPLLASAIHTPVNAFGLIFSAGLAGAALGAFTFGPLADRFGRRWPLIIACILFAVFSIATVFVTSFSQLLVVRTVTGIGLGGAVPTCLAIVAEYAPKRIRGLAVTAMFSSFPLGGFIGGIAASYLISSYGWQSIFLLGGSLPIVIGSALIAQVPESLRFLAARGADDTQLREIVAKIGPDLLQSELSFKHSEQSSRRNPVKDLFAEGRALVTVLLWGPFFLGFMVILTVVLWGPSILHESGIPLSVSALIFASHYLGGFVGTAWSGHLVDKFGPVKVLVLGFLLGAICLALFGRLTSSIILLGIDAFLCGLFVVGATNGMLAVAAMLYPTHIRSTGIGWAMGVGRFGQLVGPIAVGWMLAAHLGTPFIFFAAAIACVVSATFLGLLAILSLRRSSLGSLAASDTKQTIQ